MTKTAVVTAVSETPFPQGKIAEIIVSRSQQMTWSGEVHSVFLLYQLVKMAKLKFGLEVECYAQLLCSQTHQYTVLHGDQTPIKFCTLLGKCWSSNI